MSLPRTRFAERDWRALIEDTQEVHGDDGDERNAKQLTLPEACHTADGLRAAFARAVPLI